MRLSRLIFVTLIVGSTALVATPSSVAAAEEVEETNQTEGTDDTSNDEPSNGPPPYLRTDVIMAGTLTLGAIHHVDHVLRDNHSGWPFTHHVTPFTFSLAIYPIYGTAYALKAGPLSYIVIDSVASVGLGLAHTLIEPPHDQYHPWAEGTNLNGVESSALGRAAQSVSVGLSLALAGHLVSSIVDGKNHGFTWRRTTSEEDDEGVTVRASPASFASGSGLTITGRF